MKKTNMKKYVISLGTVAMLTVPVVAAISCSTTDSPYTAPKDGFSLNNISGGAAHSYFRGGGAVKVGSKLSLTVNGKTYSTTWTAEDAAAEAQASEPAELFEIVIQNFLSENPSLQRADVVNALGSNAVNGGHHGSTISAQGVVTAIDFTNKATDRDFWHTYFRNQLEDGFGSENIKAGTPIMLKVGDDTVMSIWTPEDVAAEADLDANQLLNYVVDKFAKQYTTDLAHEALDHEVTTTDSHGVASTKLVVEKEDSAAFIAKFAELEDEATSDVEDAFGTPSSSHHTYVRGAGTTANPIDMTAPTTSRGTSANTTLWHTLFRFDNPNSIKVGDVLSVTLADGTKKTFTWTAADTTNEAKLNQDGLFNYMARRFNDKDEAPSMTETKTNVALDSTEKAIRTAFGVDKSGHHNVPVGTPEVAEQDAAFDFTDAINSRAVWHHAFRGEGEYLADNIGVGSVIKLRVLGNYVYYTWTSADVTTEANLGPDDLQDYVANKFYLAANGMYSLEQIRLAMGFDLGAADGASSHHAYPEWGYASGVWNITPPLKRGSSTEYQANTTIWHDMFRVEELLPGQVVQINIGSTFASGKWTGGVAASFIWTEQDAANEDALNQDDLFDYLSRRLMGKSATDAFTETKAGTTLSTVDSGVSKADYSHGTVSIDAANQSNEAAIRTAMAVDVAGHHGVGQ